MKNFIKLMCVGIIALQTACSTHTAFINYKDFKSDMPIKAEAYKGQMLGQVAGEEGGAVWDNCTTKAQGSVRAMIANARAMGANAIGEVRWAANGSSTPTCKKSWGYCAMPIFLLTPLFLSTKVMGTAYKVTGKATADLFLLPENPAFDASLAADIVAQAN